MPVTINIKKLEAARDLPLPAFQSKGAAGLDLMAAIRSDEPVTIPPNGRVLVPTGLVFQIPEGFEGQVRPRSGLALRYGITVLNSPGTIDSDYRGEIGVILINLGSEPFEITRGMRIAQLVVAQVNQGQLMEVLELKETERGDGGFGSTGSTQPSEG
ncbi:MAG: dUTP diphosphatase [Beijerinckiaceae bacterium]|jgi:dUTP pyrophosphatase|nr:dUTP diphosphatase [Beijerinckiaceae bacterium]